jgi:hypothetical protein
MIDAIRQRSILRRIRASSAECPGVQSEPVAGFVMFQMRSDVVAGFVRIRMR